MTDNEIARKAWGMGCKQLAFYTGGEGCWAAMEGSEIRRGERNGFGDSPQEAMLDYVDMAEGAIELDGIWYVSRDVAGGGGKMNHHLQSDRAGVWAVFFDRSPFDNGNLSSVEKAEIETLLQENGLIRDPQRSDIINSRWVRVRVLEEA